MGPQGIDLSPFILNLAKDTAHSYQNSFNRMRQGQFLQGANTVEDAGNIIGAFPMGRMGLVAKSAAREVSPQLVNKAVNVLRGNLKQDDLRLIEGFSEAVGQNRARRNLGDQGQLIQSLIQNAFGSKARNWSNKTVNDALEMVLRKIYG